MRAALVLVLVVVLAGCGREKDFDTRFNDTASELGNRANQIDADLNAQQARDVQPPG